MRKIVLKGAREHNLKGVDLELPQGRFICFVGVSGSGKSTLAFDVIGAEAERRFLESLSPFARQLLGPLRRPQVEAMEGLQPPITVRRGRAAEGPRSTVGTVTEIYDHLRLIFARAGRVSCPRCGREIKAWGREEMVEEVMAHPSGQKVMVLVPVRPGDYTPSRLLREGFTRAFRGGKVVELDALEGRGGGFDLLVDRLVLREAARGRLRESLELALRYAEVVKVLVGEEELLMSSRPYCPRCDLAFPRLTPALFSFNTPEGACPQCKGLGRSEGGPCPACKGRKLREEALSVRVGGYTIAELENLPAEELEGLLPHLPVPSFLQEAVRSAIERLAFLREVGVGYLCLDRPVRTLSAGEAQRVRLATQLGMGLSGVLYLLDEPSVGLHPRDQHRVVETLKALRDLGNTVIVVEHDPGTILAADWVVELGPGAGERGGEVIYSGPPAGLLRQEASPTGAYLSGRLRVELRRSRRSSFRGQIVVRGAELHNLKGITVPFPLGGLCCVTGVSGSGKSTLVLDVLAKGLKVLKEGGRPEGCEGIEGHELIDGVVVVDQDPPGGGSRSNPATYSGAFAPIRGLFAQTHEARVKGWGPSRFSFNVKGGRCEACEGQGRVRVELGFLPEVYVTCEHCGGTRYQPDVLEVKYRGYNIAEVLDMTVEEALEFFKNVPPIRDKLRPLKEVGLGYLRLGHPLEALSGGEAQRLKLARELGKGRGRGVLYVLDEPTTGLHFSEIVTLLEVLDRLIEEGGSVIVIEHNLEVVKNADWVIDLGPEGGEGGGEVVAMGAPEEVARSEGSRTAPFLREALGP